MGHSTVSRRLRRMKLLAIGAFLMACVGAALAQAAPIVDVGPYILKFGGNNTWSVRGRVDLGGAGYIYTYRVENVTDDPQSAEFLIEEHENHAGLHHEVAASVTPGPGQLRYDDAAQAAQLALAAHNYDWDNPGFQIAWTAHQTQTFIFEDVHGPAMADWGLIDTNSPLAANRFRTNTTENPVQGQLPVPNPNYVPEPASVILFGFALGSMSYLARAQRRARRSKNLVRTE